eukprot:7140448-Prymnesium_polylepis.1
MARVLDGLASTRGARCGSHPAPASAAPSGSGQGGGHASYASRRRDVNRCASESRRHNTSPCIAR